MVGSARGGLARQPGCVHRGRQGGQGDREGTPGDHRSRDNRRSQPGRRNAGPVAVRQCSRSLDDRTAPSVPMPTPIMPSRSIPRGVHADGTPADLPPLPADEIESDSTGSESSEPMPSPQTKKIPLPKPATDSGANKAEFTLPKAATMFLPSFFMPSTIDRLAVPACRSSRCRSSCRSVKSSRSRSSARSLRMARDAEFRAKMHSPRRRGPRCR